MFKSVVMRTQQTTSVTINVYYDFGKHACVCVCVCVCVSLLGGILYDAKESLVFGMSMKSIRVCLCVCGVHCYCMVVTSCRTTESAYFVFGCVFFPAGMLLKDPVKRISIPDIRRHP